MRSCCLVLVSALLVSLACSIAHSATWHCVENSVVTHSPEGLCQEIQVDSSGDLVSEFSQWMLEFYVATDAADGIHFGEVTICALNGPGGCIEEFEYIQEAVFSVESGSARVVADCTKPINHLIEGGSAHDSSLRVCVTAGGLTDGLTLGENLDWGCPARVMVRSK